MEQNVFTVRLRLDWNLVNKISQIDKFGGEWSALEKREWHSLKQLKFIATEMSVGASTRIEGSRMTDDEVEVFLKNLSISKLQERDQQEVAGYFETLNLITGSFHNMEITENNLKYLHQVLTKYSTKDQWHRGDYKQHSNVVESVNADGSKYVIFKTTAPGYETEDAMRALVEWYRNDLTVPPLIKTALFAYEFLSIHPFQDGNGRLSRLITTFLLLKNNYPWIQYVSFEHELENRKSEYYQVLLQCQRQRPGEDISAWVNYFMSCMDSLQLKLMNKFAMHGKAVKMTIKEKKIYAFIDNHPGCQSGEIAEKLEIPLPTVKRMLTSMVAGNLLLKHGVGAGTNYTTDN